MTKPIKIQSAKKKIVIPTSKRIRWTAQAIAFFKKQALPLTFGGLCLGIVAAFVGLFFIKKTHSKAAIIVPTTEIEAPLNIASTVFMYPDILPDFYTNTSYSFTPEIIETDIKLHDFLQQKGVEQSARETIVFQAAFKSLQALKRGQLFYTFTANTTKPPFYLYEIARDSFALFLLSPQPSVKIKTIALSTKLQTTTGIVKDTFFWTSFLNNKGDHRLIPQIVQALKWQVDFYHVQPNDRYKLVYETHWHQAQQMGIGQLVGIFYQSRDKTYYAFRFGEKGKTQFFDKKGQRMQARFLKSPVEYNIINSPYNPNRLHPIHNKMMPHYGTDYHANLNDPVFAVGKGKVIKVSSTKYNGNYVKIKHDHIYQSQYLHLNKFVPSIKVGTSVEQGDIIGYAGETGLATGVHVCFRFWKNKTQVDFTKQAVVQQASMGISPTHRAAFEQARDSLKIILDAAIFQ